MYQKNSVVLRDFLGMMMLLDGHFCLLEHFLNIYSPSLVLTLRNYSWQFVFSEKVLTVSKVLKTISRCHEVLTIRKSLMRLVALIYVHRWLPWSLLFLTINPQISNFKHPWSPPVNNILYFRTSQFVLVLNDTTTIDVYKLLNLLLIRSDYFFSNERLSANSQKHDRASVGLSTWPISLPRHKSA